MPHKILKHPRVPWRTLSPWFLRGLFIFIFIACERFPAGAQSPPQQGGTAVSTVPAAGAAAPEEINLTLNLSTNADDSRVVLDYSVRWDFKDILSFRPGFKAMSSGFKAVSSWDVTKNTRIDFYGMKGNPWKMILSNERYNKNYSAAGITGQAGAGAGLVNRKPTVSRRRPRPGLSPLIDDFIRNSDEILRDLLLRASLQWVSPQWEKAGKEGRREFVRDVLSMGIWDMPAPGVKESMRGLEYLADEPDSGFGHMIHRPSSTLTP
ncbi:MAG: hypothetical protein Q7R35_11405 [Elusimicrobiota bacterium]|nr:hypothetical protein [Elusimicrobiota bacterium]